MKANFVVQHDVLSGLKYLQVTKRKGIRVAKNEEMIVRVLSVGEKGRSGELMRLIGRDLSRQIRRISRCMRRSVSICTNHLAHSI